MMKWKVVKGPRSASVDRSLDCLKEKYVYPVCINDSNNNTKQKQQDGGFVRKPSLVASDCINWKGFLGLTRQRSESNLSALSPAAPLEHPRQRSRSEVRHGWLRGSRQTVVAGTRSRSRGGSRTVADQSDAVVYAEIEHKAAPPPRRSKKGQAPRPGDVNLNPSGGEGAGSCLLERKASPSIRGRTSTVVAEVHGERKDRRSRKDEKERNGYDRNGFERKDTDRKNVERKDTVRKDVEKMDTDKKDVERNGYDRNGFERKDTDRKNIERRDTVIKDLERMDTERNGCDRNGLERKDADRKNAEKKDTVRKDVERMDTDKKDVEKNGYDRRIMERKDTENRNIDRKDFERKDADRKNNDRSRKDIDEKDVERYGSDRMNVERNDIENMDIERKDVDRKDIERMDSERNNMNSRDINVGRNESEMRNTERWNGEKKNEKTSLPSEEIEEVPIEASQSLEEMEFKEQERVQEVQIEIPPFRIDTPDYSTLESEQNRDFIEKNNLRNNIASQDNIKVISCTEKNNLNICYQNQDLDNTLPEEGVSSILRGPSDPTLHKKVVRFEKLDLIESYKKQKGSDDDETVESPPPLKLDVNSNEIECPHMRVDLVVKHPPAECVLSVDSPPGQLVVKKSFVLTVAKQEKGFRSLCANKRPEVAKKDHKISVTFLCSEDPLPRIRSVSVPPPQPRPPPEIAPPPPLVRGRSRDRRSKERHSKRSKSAKKKDSSHHMPQAVIDELAQVLEKRKPSLDRPTAKAT